MTKNSLKDLYIDELRDIFDAENQITKALPKMVKASSSEELRQAFEQHLEQTKGQIERLEKIFKMLGQKSTGKKCFGMEGLLREGSEIMGEDFGEELMDAALISAAQRVEHYEIAAYGTVCSFASLLGESEHKSLLEETLNEEKQTDKNLTEISKHINPETEHGEMSEEEREKRKSRRIA
ncbi:MAG: ferritin-like domain-containing protein [Acidobacteria bacterium]|nr:MAG: ferritin-like domain-containing protein [Acidobacteriota bacterium]